MKNIKTKEEANCFLEEYLPIFNKQFAKQPKSNISVFNKLSKNFDYEWSFALEESRVVENDYTIRYKGCIYQINDTLSILRKRRILIRESIYGAIKMFYKGKELSVRKIETQRKGNNKKNKAREA